MAWTTRKVYIDDSTSEVLNEDAIRTGKYEIIKTTKLYHKINDTHIERIIIQHCREARQQQLF